MCLASFNIDNFEKLSCEFFLNPFVPEKSPQNDKMFHALLAPSCRSRLFGIFLSQTSARVKGQRIQDVSHFFE